jgi:hypothetical protein
MQAARIPVDVIMERVALHHRWASERWQPIVVVPVDASFAARPASERLDNDGERAHWRCGGCDIELHPSEAEGYYLNLTAPDPKAFVMWRLFEEGEPLARPVLVTVSYYEAARFMDANEYVEGVALPPSVAGLMRAFVATHYRPEPKRKGRRHAAAAQPDGERKP